MRLQELKDPQRIARRLHRRMKSEGMLAVLRGLSGRIYTARASSSGLCQELLAGKVGFEIGGPSLMFRDTGQLPIYPIVGRIDNCNFSAETVWEGRISEGRNFVYDASHEPGYQYMREAVELSGIPSNAYDFVLSCHTLEHVANPLRALEEGKRLLKDYGTMILVVPHRDGTFDHRRPVTAFSHLVQDFDSNVGEDDLSHLPEILRLHDLELDAPAGDFEDFEKRSAENFQNRCLHHHVFDTQLVAVVADYVGLKIRAIEPLRPFHIIAVGQKLPAGELPHNDLFLRSDGEYLRRSPFPSDRVSRRARG